MLRRETYSIEVSPEKVGVLLAEYYDRFGVVGGEVVAE